MQKINTSLCRKINRRTFFLLAPEKRSATPDHEISLPVHGERLRRAGFRFLRQFLHYTLSNIVDASSKRILSCSHSDVWWVRAAKRQRSFRQFPYKGEILRPVRRWSVWRHPGSCSLALSQKDWLSWADLFQPLKLLSLRQHHPSTRASWTRQLHRLGNAQGLTDEAVLVVHEVDGGREGVVLNTSSAGLKQRWGHPGPLRKRPSSSGHSWPWRRRSSGFHRPGGACKSGPGGWHHYLQKRRGSRLSQVRGNNPDGALRRWWPSHAAGTWAKTRSRLASVKLAHYLGAACRTGRALR